MCNARSKTDTVDMGVNDDGDAEEFFPANDLSYRNSVDSLDIDETDHGNGKLSPVENNKQTIISKRLSTIFPQLTQLM